MNLLQIRSYRIYVKKVAVQFLGFVFAQNLVFFYFPGTFGSAVFSSHVLHSACMMPGLFSVSEVYMP